MASEFYISDYKDAVIKSYTNHKDNSNARLARSLLSSMEDSIEQPLNLDRPADVRDKIFEYYRDQEDYDSIKSSHLNPVKKLLKHIAEKEEDNSLRRNAYMIHDTLIEKRIPDQKSDLSKLESKILYPDEKRNLENQFSGEKRLAIELFLESCAKIGAVSAITKEDFDEEKNRIDISSQYKQEKGDKELPRHRERNVDVSNDLSRSYRNTAKRNDSKYLFGDNISESYHNLREIIDEINAEFDSHKINSRVLRNTAGYYKSKKMDSEDLMREMGLKTETKVQKFRKIVEKREA